MKILFLFPVLTGIVSLWNLLPGVAQAQPIHIDPSTTWVSMGLVGACSISVVTGIWYLRGWMVKVDMNIDTLRDRINTLPCSDCPKQQEDNHGRTHF